MTPSRFLKEHIYVDIPQRKKSRKKVTSENFIIPEYGEHEKLLEINFNVRQLREIARYYKQKRSGNKPQLLFTIYNFLKFSKFVIIIQKYIRGYICRHYNILRGPGFLHREKCVNETDFITLEKLKNIPKKQFYSFAESGEEGFIYGFDICSLYNLLHNKKYPSINPYNRQKLPTDCIAKIKHIIKMAPIFGEKINILFEDSYKGLSNEKRVALLGIAIFQKIDNLGNHSNSQWLLSLNRLNLIKFVRELMDIWVFRANLSPLVKRNICPPAGNPFIGFNILNNHFHINELKRKILHIIDIFVTKGRDRDSRVLGALYVLTALTLVSKDAAEARPELYHSAMHV